MQMGTGTYLLVEGLVLPAWTHLGGQDWDCLFLCIGGIWFSGGLVSAGVTDIALTVNLCKLFKLTCIEKQHLIVLGRLRERMIREADTVKSLNQ